MWTAKDISDTALLLALIASSPFIFAFMLKMATYLLNRYFPRDAIVTLKSSGRGARTLYIKRRLFRRATIYDITKNQGSQTRAHT